MVRKSIRNEISNWLTQLNSGGGLRRPLSSIRKALAQLMKKCRAELSQDTEAAAEAYRQYLFLGGEKAEEAQARLDSVRKKNELSVDLSPLEEPRMRGLA